MKKRIHLFRFYLGLLLAVTFLLIVRLFNPSDNSGSGLLLGYSFGRIIVLLPVLLLTLMLIVLFVRTWRNPLWFARFESRFHEILDHESIYYLFVLGSTAVILLGAWIHQIGSAIHDPYFQGYFSKISSFLLWGIGVASLTLLFVRLYRYGWDMDVFSSQGVTFKASGVAFSLLLLLAVLIGLTGLGLKPDLVGWGDPGTPVLPSQVLLLSALIVTALSIGEILGERWPFLRDTSTVDLPIFVLFWLLTIWLWGAQPLTPAYFAPQPVAPNYEYYPYSDAANYDVSAHELLIGMGFGGNVRRPLYSLFLALAQLASGVGYDQILLWQIPLLALIPPLLYLLGRGLHSRLGGMMTASLALFHELNAIRLSSVVNVSHAKLLMSDLPTALGVIAFSVVLVYWWQMPKQRKVYPLLAGGILALTMLIRIQVILLLPGVLLVMLISFWNLKRQFSAAAVLLFVGMGCVLIPWLWRGQQTRGSLSFAEAAQESQVGLIGVRYSLNPDPVQGASLPGENRDQYAQRMLTSAVDFIALHPLKTLEFISSHLLHNQISTFLTLPPIYASAVPIPYLETKFARTWEACCSVQAYLANLPFWANWDGRFPKNALLPMIFNLLLLSVGLGIAWKQNRALGLLPLWISLCYALGNSMVRSSGWRFNLPVDWVGLFYYGLGIVQVIIWGVMFFANRVWPVNQGITSETTQRSFNPFPWKRAIIISGFLFLTSAAIPMTEVAIPFRYSDSWFSQALNDPRLGQRLYQIGISERLPDFAARNDMQLLWGRALYPRYYAPKQGIPGEAWFAFIPRDYPRLGFYLVGIDSQNVVLPLEDQPPSFPHAADVIVIGCPQDEFLEAKLVILTAKMDVVFQHAPISEWNCNPGK